MNKGVPKNGMPFFHSDIRLEKMPLQPAGREILLN